MRARRLRNEPVDVVLVDRRNYHLFTPLLYQVASCLLAPGEIAAPLRKVFRGAGNVRFRMGDVARIDYDARIVHLADGAQLPYHFVVLAAGSRTNYFGNDDLAEHTFGLKDLGEALQLRNHVLDCLERATSTTDPDERRRLLTFCIVGGGPTGVEYAGALAELVRLVLPLEYPEIAPITTSPSCCSKGPIACSARSSPGCPRTRAESCERRGVDVRTNALVASADDKFVRTRDGGEIETATMIWTAGVRAESLTVVAPAPHTAADRIEIDEFLRIPGTDNAFAIGDSAAADDGHGAELPMTSPPAMQAGRYVARQIIGTGPRKPFKYRDKGTLATIGRTAAVGEVGPLTFTGFIGWIVWLVVHLYYMIGFENRLIVMLRWSWYYVRYDRPVRAIIRAHPPRRS